MIEETIKKSMSLIIPGTLIRDMNDSDLDRVIEDYSLAEEAREALINGSITLDDYLGVLEVAGVEIDSYINIVDSNLRLIGMS